MRPQDEEYASNLSASLDDFQRDEFRLPGISRISAKRSWIEQIVESVRRDRYIFRLRDTIQNPAVADSRSPAFDPIKAALFHQQQGNFDEACWLIFLSVHFGKNRRTGWRLCRDVYGSLGGRDWTWIRINQDFPLFIDWLIRNMSQLRGSDGIQRYFGNHRKYQSLSATSGSGTGAALHSYLQLVQPFGSHRNLVTEFQVRTNADRRLCFARLYDILSTVASFGRMAKFDYLAQLGRTNLFPIEPDLPYLRGATGPLTGAKLLLTGQLDTALSIGELEQKLVQLEGALRFGMQAMEDSLCNWQKSPTRFVPFRG